LATVKKYSPLKLLGQMEPHLAGSLYVRSSITFRRFVPFGQQIWLPKAILVSDWLMLNKSSPLKLLGQAKFGLIWPRSFRGKYLFNISQSKTRIALGNHICWLNGTK
jgi:hypothetical protein